MLLAVALLAALTGASNRAPTGGGSGQDLAVGLAATGQDVPAGAKATGKNQARAATGQAASPAATVGAGAPTTTLAGQPTTTAAGTAGPAGEAAAAGAAGEDAAAPEPEAEAEPETAPARVRAAPAPAPVEPPPPPPSPAPVGLTRLSNVELEVLTLTNMDRGNNGVPPVSRDSCLDAEASAWAHAMADSEVMAHSAGGGAAVQGCRGANAYWGDNIGYWEPCVASEMEAWWMNSPSHRPHIVDPHFTAVGIGVWAEPSGRCWFEVYFGS
ncbi:MAG: hypothetical protein QOG43_2554 [Actinomycetota bacterium]|jgi:uncharacterized protein YkwD|nr:hypothetical protein [Actinomycetota bacterium]